MYIAENFSKSIHSPITVHNYSCKSDSFSAFNVIAEFKSQHKKIACAYVTSEFKNDSI